MRYAFPACGFGSAAHTPNALEGRDNADGKPHENVQSSVSERSRGPARSESPFVYDGNELMTPFYRLRFTERGTISSLQTAAGKREVVAREEELNRFLLAEDVPVQWDAWNVSPDYRDKRYEEPRLVSTEVISNGPVFFRLRWHYAVGAASRMTQDLVAYAHTRRIDFATRVDWHEDHRILRAEFPLRLHTATVRCDINGGWIDRESHGNTPADRARYEFCAHKYISASDGATTIAVLNDGKYGHSADGATLGITLLRSPTSPDSTADRGRHDFTYAICAYDCGFVDADIARDAYELNVPPVMVGGGERPQTATEDVSTRTGTTTPARDAAGAGSAEAADLPVGALLEIEERGIVLETVKAAESREGIVVRVIETLGIPHRFTLRSAFTFDSVQRTNMLERNPQPVAHHTREVAVDLAPFEIATFQLTGVVGCKREAQYS